ncbi:DUF1772 domain-containing protein [Cryptosporangium aurantiacum]|uniref:Uncharacterized membrane protein n=1 Tax=Cryptosporangium aurantiacum TaxID=134849 RepID=A0A1M7R9A4_9ACTN|nr:anthrone oxygenase family protein [Cryptosporangium aurantiacum]SHN42730.1 Uncharacterized membrane protein [Cryptosporangium aurantiacum]
MLFRNVTLIAATAATGLAAGLYYTFACAVMPGLRQVDDRTFVDAMQRINVAILNGWFALSFAGALILTVLAGILEWRAGERSAALWIAVAAAIYVTTLLITFVLNVPLNNQLNDAGDPARIADLAAVRADFEASWVRWNIVRAVLATASLATLAYALLRRAES